MVLTVVKSLNLTSLKLKSLYKSILVTSSHQYFRKLSPVTGNVGLSWKFVCKRIAGGTNTKVICCSIILNSSPVLLLLCMVASDCEEMQVASIGYNNSVLF